MILANLLMVLILIGVLAYHRLSLKISSLIILAGMVLSSALNFHYHTHSRILTAVLLGILLLFMIMVNIASIRKKLISQKIFLQYKKVMPKLSSTEREALEGGTVCWSAELFNGKPDWKILLEIPAPTLSAEEKSFIEGPVEQLCSQINDWQTVFHDMDLPESVWQFIKDNGFFGLIIPKEYGGKGFSAYAHAEIIAKIYGVSATAGTTVSVPNSLGPAELLLHYGTGEQKQYYLPRLAKGEEIPCFALTAPTAGSDATSITDSGVICKGEFNHQEIIGIKLNWNKRYITLAPCASVMGLAFKLYDPDKLISPKESYGITCALIPTNLPGITIGRRHLPLGSAFMNGPTEGKDVFVPLDYIIGGIKMAGCGWRMLIECLAAGRAISLPTTIIGGSKMAVFATSAYASIRKQFQLPIGKFEGVSEALSRMAGYLYLMESSKNVTMSIIDQGQKPAILSAIMKYHITELGRKIACDAMDVHGGKGICLGPRNYLARFYQTVPIAITVEGANILTRSLMIFGQGALRCHRYILKEFYAGEQNNLDEFDKAIWGHAGLLLSNIIRSVWLGITGGFFVANPVKDKSVKKYYQQLSRFSSAYALLADFSVLMMGSKLKRREKLSGRLGDILSYLFLLSAVLKNDEDQRNPVEEKFFIEWVFAQYLCEIQQKLDQVLQNFPYKWASAVLRILIFPLGKNFKLPTDVLSQKLAESIMVPGKVRDRLTQHMFKGGLMGEIEEAFVTAHQAETDDSLKVKADKLTAKIIAVDHFSKEELKRG
jgi:acyl-CoA dehydrogenase